MVFQVDPEVFVLGGGVVDAGELLLGRTRRRFFAELPARGKLPVAPIVAAQLGNMAGVVRSRRSGAPAMTTRTRPETYGCCATTWTVCVEIVTRWTRWFVCLTPDLVIVQGAPRRFRWRTRCADLADRFRLLYTGGGEPSLGNLVLVSMRVSVREVRYPHTH